jgi:hypothetical protein
MPAPPWSDCPGGAAALLDIPTGFWPLHGGATPAILSV